jgi:hypothetical protein
MAAYISQRGGISMMRMPFKRPTEHYDERAYTIDEQICGLIRQRKAVSENEPGYPPLEFIADWAKRFGFNEEFLRSIFMTLFNEEHFKPFIEPERYLKIIPVNKFVEKDDRIFFVTHIRQYTNASIVNFNIDSIVMSSPDDRPQQHHFFKLSAGQKYDCYMIGGGGSTDHYSYNFVITPALPDDISGLELVFREYKHDNKPTGFEIVIHVD